MLSRYDDISERGTHMMEALETLFSSPKFISLSLCGATQPPSVLGSPPASLQTARTLTVHRTHLPCSQVAWMLLLKAYIGSLQPYL